MAVVKCTFGMDSGSAACVFKGVIEPHGQSVFSKFCKSYKSYNTAARQAMAAAGYAPALLGSEQLVQAWC